MKDNLEKIFFAVVVVTIFLITSVDTVSSATSRTNTTAPTNVMVDIGATSIDSNLRKGDTGLLTLVVKNTGSQKAEKVEIWIKETTYVKVNKKFYIGTMDAQESKKLQVMITIANDAKTGLTSIPVTIYYDGYDSYGAKKENLYTNWEIPIRIYSNPNFQISAQKTDYIRGNVDNLTLVVISGDYLKDLTLGLSSTSNCMTIIGSSRRYISEISPNKNFVVDYKIKPNTAGTCVALLSLSYIDASGEVASDELSIGLNIEDTSVDFKILNISYSSPSPGDNVKIKLILKNVGKTEADDVTVLLSLTSPFVPVNTNERYISKVLPGEIFEVEFDIAISWDAETKVYSIPLKILYKVGGISYIAEKDIGIDVSGKVLLEVINVATSRGAITIDVANLGTRTAEAVKATLTFYTIPEDFQQISQEQNFSQQQISERRARFSNRTQFGNFSRQISQQSFVSYKSDIKPGKQATFTFSVQNYGQALLTLEYTGLNNQRITQTERITIREALVGSAGNTSSLRGSRGTNDFLVYAFYVIAALILIFIIYRKLKSEPILPGFISKKFSNK
ncbi:MAG: hypothetical protein QW802_01450 [Candidatus Altiarchaeota archaeon]